MNRRPDNYVKRLQRLSAIYKYIYFSNKRNVELMLRLNTGGQARLEYSQQAND